MKEYAVVFTPEAQQQLVELYGYIAEKTTVDTALRYINAVTDYCEGMRMFPHRGTQRNDIRPGLRITHYRKRAVIAFTVDDVSDIVTVIGVFYGGRSYFP